MRVNHTGEVCAQALYSGQSLVARDAKIREALVAAAAEERDHQSWCRDRLSDLHSRPSLLDPLWYAGSFAWGLASGLAGDRWSLGFLAETEAQVEKHLEGHLDLLPADDGTSCAIVAKMRDDEARHGQTTFARRGGASLRREARCSRRESGREPPTGCEPLGSRTSKSNVTCAVFASMIVAEQYFSFGLIAFDLRGRKPASRHDVAQPDRREDLGSSSARSASSSTTQSVTGWRLAGCASRRSPWTPQCPSGRVPSGAPRSLPPMSCAASTTTAWPRRFRQGTSSPPRA